MTLYHRFCAFIPLFLAIAALSGCAGNGRTASPWPSASATPSSVDTTQSSSAAVYGQAPVMPAPTPASSSPAVKVAILLPLSGSNASVGQSMLQAAQLAVFDIGNDNFELISKDTQGTPQGAVAAANAALNEGAQLILGPLFADEVRAVKGATMGRVNILAFSTDWSLAGNGTYIMGFTPFSQVQRIVQYAAGKGYKKAAVAAPTDTYGTAVARAFETDAQAAGMQISRALSDPNSYDCVFIPAAGASLASTLQRVTNTSAKKLGTGLWDDPRIASDPAMNGAIFAAPSPSARRGFESRYQSTYGTAPVRIATLAYDATALAAALARSSYQATGRPTFTAQSLTTPSGFAGVDGIMRFKSDGLLERGMSILEIRGGRAVEIDPAPATFAR